MEIKSDELKAEVLESKNDDKMFTGRTSTNKIVIF